MADDTIAYLDRVIGGPAHLVGWSDGAVVGLLVALRRPDLVDRLVLIGQYYNSSGKVPGGLADQLGAGGDQVMGFLRGDYDRVSPVEAPRSSTPCWCGFSAEQIGVRLDRHGVWTVLRGVRLSSSARRA